MLEQQLYSINSYRIVIKRRYDNISIQVFNTCTQTPCTYEARVKPAATSATTIFCSFSFLSKNLLFPPSRRRTLALAHSPPRGNHHLLYACRECSTHLASNRTTTRVRQDVSTAIPKPSTNVLIKLHIIL